MREKGGRVEMDFQQFGQTLDLMGQAQLEGGSQMSVVVCYICYCLVYLVRV